MDIKEHVIQAAGHNLKIIPNIALNSTTKPLAGVRFEIVGLKNGTVRTRFEAGRTLSAQAGCFSDVFDSIQPHVYDLPAE